MAQIIAVMNEKGGVGKTTTAVTTAQLLAKRGHRVLLLDFDGQANSSIVLGIDDPNQVEYPVSKLLECIISESELPEKNQWIHPLPFGLHLIASSSELFALTYNLIHIPFREMKLRELLDPLRVDYDYIVIDTMPQIGIPMINVMMAADSIVIPTQAEYLSARGLSELLKHFTMIRKNGNPSLTIAGILVTMNASKTNLSAHIITMLDESFGQHIPIFRSKIPRTIKIGEASLHQKTICEYQPNSDACKAYEEFVNELEERLHGTA